MEDDDAIGIPFLGTSPALTEIYDDVRIPPLRVREGKDWNADEWIEVESD